MAIAKAPGKVVLSGAYAVLEGAPAIVSAVDRYAIADTERSSAFVTDEVFAALGTRAVPWFDAEELRAHGQKLGLGSSAAILVATLAALELTNNAALSDDELHELVFDPATTAHRAAQGGGSGIDVAASTFGGILVAERANGELKVRRVALPSELHIEVWACTKPASTSELIAKVQGLKLSEPAVYSRLLGAQAEASRRAVAALDTCDARSLVDALAAQCKALAALGEAACVPIVTSEIAELSAQALQCSAAFLPSGAGGGDIAIFVGLERPSDLLRDMAKRCGITQLGLHLGARGVHGAPASKT